MNKVLFENEGVLDIRGITTFGISAKGDNKSPIGQFGTGLKYAIAVAIRENQNISLWIEDIHYRFEVVKDSVRGKEFEFIRMIGEYDTGASHSITDLPFTTELGKNWELWMAFRELYSNTLDEQGTVVPIASDTTVSGELNKTKIIVEGDEFVNVLMERSDIFLDTASIRQMPQIEVHEGESNAVFHKGIRVAEFEKPTLYKYNITGAARLTEDRTLHSPHEFNSNLVSGIIESADAEMIAKVVSAPEEFHERSLNYPSWKTPSDTFLATLKKLIKKGKGKLNPSAVALYEKVVKERRTKKEPVVKYTLEITVPAKVSQERREEFLEGLNKYMLEFEEETGATSNLITEDGDIPF